MSWMLIAVAPLLIWGATLAYQRPQFMRLTKNDFPHVDPREFARWHQLHLWYTDLCIWTTWGSTIVAGGMIALLFWSAATSGIDGQYGYGIALVFVIVGYVIVLMFGLLITEVYQVRARRLKKKLGIKWPR